MSISETYSGLYEFIHGDAYATVELKDSGDGWVSEWWVSRNLYPELGVKLLGYFRIPVFGELKDDAKRRLGFISDEVLDFALSIAGGTGSVGAGGEVVLARKHCKAHLQYWSDVIPSVKKTEHTAVLYSFAVDFGVNNPAALIAEVEVVGVRTIHERIAHARRIQILDSYGKGLIKKPSYVEEDITEEEEFLFTKTERGFKHRNSDGEWV